MMPLEQLSVYLPYKLMCLTPKHQFKYGTQESILMTGLSINLGELIVEFLRDDDLEFSNTMKWFKPLLHPLSKIDFNDLYEKFGSECDAYHDAIEALEVSKERVLMMPYEIVVYLAKNHMDIFNWIDQGLAEPIK